MRKSLNRENLFFATVATVAVEAAVAAEWAVAVEDGSAVAADNGWNFLGAEADPPESVVVLGVAVLPYIQEENSRFST